MKVRTTYNKYSKVPSSTGATGYDVARRILDAHGLYDVQIEEIRGVLTDHYDPRAKVVRLSSDIYHGHSLAAIAVAAHECGHALQDQEEYAFLRFRSALVPLASFGSNISWILILAGIFLTATNLLLLGIIFMAFAVLFQVVTLPVEFNASSRAMNQVVSLGLIRNEEEGGARKVLNAAAMTYVAAAAVAVIELLRFILMYFAMNSED
ncbi:zinc metallopeptidase [Pallidibacillus pasinlerensis]